MGHGGSPRPWTLVGSQRRWERGSPRPQPRPRRPKAWCRGQDRGTAQVDTAVPPLGFVGPQKTLVILAQFADRPSVGTTPEQWNARFFGATDSVRAFYRGASSGNLDLTPATESSGTANDGVIGWVSLPINHPNYYDTIDSRAQDVTARAIRAADPFINYANYDTNSNGAIEPAELHLTVIAAGYEGSYGTACSPSVWGHRWAVPTASAPSSTARPSVAVATRNSGNRIATRTIRAPPTRPRSGSWHTSSVTTWAGRTCTTPTSPPRGSASGA